MRYEEMEAKAKDIADRAILHRIELTEDQQQTRWQATFHFHMFTLLSVEEQRQVDEAGGLSY